MKNHIIFFASALASVPLIGIAQTPIPLSCHSTTVMAPCPAPAPVKKSNGKPAAKPAPASPLQLFVTVQQIPAAPTVAPAPTAPMDLSPFAPAAFMYAQAAKQDADTRLEQVQTVQLPVAEAQAELLKTQAWAIRQRTPIDIHVEMKHSKHEAWDTYVNGPLNALAPAAGFALGEALRRPDVYNQTLGLSQTGASTGAITQNGASATNTTNQQQSSSNVNTPTQTTTTNAAPISITNAGSTIASGAVNASASSISNPTSYSNAYGAGGQGGSSLALGGTAYGGTALGGSVSGSGNGSASAVGGGANANTGPVSATGTGGSSTATGTGGAASAASNPTLTNTNTGTNSNSNANQNNNSATGTGSASAASTPK